MLACENLARRGVNSTHLSSTGRMGGHRLNDPNFWVLPGEESSSGYGKKKRRKKAKSRNGSANSPSMTIPIPFKKQEIRRVPKDAATVPGNRSRTPSHVGAPDINTPDAPSQYRGDIPGYYMGPPSSHPRPRVIKPSPYSILPKLEPLHSQTSAEESRGGAASVADQTQPSATGSKSAAGAAEASDLQPADSSKKAHKQQRRLPGSSNNPGQELKAISSVNQSAALAKMDWYTGDKIRQPPQWMTDYNAVEHHPAFLARNEEALEAALASLPPISEHGHQRYDNGEGAAHHYSAAHLNLRSREGSVTGANLRGGGATKRSLLGPKEASRFSSMANLSLGGGYLDEDIVDMKGYPGRNKGWDFNAIKEQLQSEGLYSALADDGRQDEQEEGEFKHDQDPGREDEPSTDAGGVPVIDARQSQQENEETGSGIPSPKHRLLPLEDVHWKEKDLDSDDDLPSLWPAHGSRPEELAAAGQPADAVGRLHPWLLACCHFVGEQLLLETLTEWKLEGSNHKLDRRVTKPVNKSGRQNWQLGSSPFNLDANGLEELLLIEVRKRGQPLWKPPHLKHYWKLDEALDQGSRTYSDEISRLPLPSARPLAQICRCAMMVIHKSNKKPTTIGRSKRDFYEQPGRSAAPEHDGGRPGLSLILPIMSSCDVPGILHVLELNALEIIQNIESDLIVANQVSTEQHAEKAMSIMAPGLGEADVKESHSLDSDFVAEIPKAVLEKTYITSIELVTGNSLDDSGIANLAVAMRGLKHVKKLDLSHHAKLTWRCCGPLAALLNTSLGDPTKSMAKLRLFPKHGIIGCGMCKMTSLTLDGVPIGDVGLEILARSLMNNVYLNTLSLQRTGLTHGGAETLATILLHNNHIKDLQLSWNQMLCSGAKTLGSALSENQALIRLGIAMCGLTDPGGTYIAQALQHNNTLQEIDLSSNSLGPSTCLVLGEALRTNMALRVLLLNGNPLRQEGGLYLAGLSLNESAIQRLGLQDVSFNEDQYEGKHRDTLFNPESPGGVYDLDLSAPVQRQVAIELLRLLESHGPNSWEAVMLNGNPFKGPAKQHRWPDHMPETGRLQLKFKPQIRPPPGTEAIKPGILDSILTEMKHPAAVDIWRTAVMKVFAAGFYFTAEQAAKLVSTFEWERDRVEAVILLFPRILDAANIDDLLGILSRERRKQAFAKLGMTAYLRPENPTGHYYLHLSRQLERIVAQRLLIQARAETASGEANVDHCNFRNVLYNGAKVKITKPHEYELPVDGVLKFDYITYQLGTIRNPDNTLERAVPYRKAMDRVNFARLIGAVKTLVEWEQRLFKNKEDLHVDFEVVPAAEGVMTMVNMIEPTMVPGLGKKKKNDAPARKSLGDMMKEWVSTQITRRLNPFTVAAVLEDGTATLSKMLKAAEASEAAQDAQEEVRVLGQKEFKRAASQVDAGAISLAKGPLEKTRTKDKWMAAALKILSLELTWDGLADIWDTEALTLAPLNVVRMYGSKYFCSCRQIVQLINSFDPNVPAEGLLRISMAQSLFTRLVDIKHFADVLRQMTPSEQVQTMRRLGFQNCINFNRRDYMHLNGLCFLIRIGVKEERLVAKQICDYIWQIENPAFAGEATNRSILNGLQINGAPASIREDHQTLFSHLCMMGKEREKPDATWDPHGTLEFQLLLPRGWMKERAAIHVQSIYRMRKAMKLIHAARDAKFRRTMKSNPQQAESYEKVKPLLMESLARNAAPVSVAEGGLLSARSLKSTSRSSIAEAETQ